MVYLILEILPRSNKDGSLYITDKFILINTLDNIYSIIAQGL